MKLLDRASSRAELGVAAGLAALAVYVLIDATSIVSTAAQRGPVGPGAAPRLVGIGMLVCALVLAWDVLRGGRGEMEGGEDVDETASTDWRTVAVVAGAFLFNWAFIERLGWVISAGIMFAVCALALGARRPVRVAVISGVVSTATFYVFTQGLGVYLPAGVLQGVL